MAEYLNMVVRKMVNSVQFVTFQFVPAVRCACQIRQGHILYILIHNEPICYQLINAVARFVWETVIRLWCARGLSQNYNRKKMTCMQLCNSKGKRVILLSPALKQRIECNIIWNANNHKFEHIRYRTELAFTIPITDVMCNWKLTFIFYKQLAICESHSP